MSPAEQRRLLSAGHRVSIAVEPLLFHVDPDVSVTRTKVTSWCFQNFTSAVFEVSATKPQLWTIECGTLDILCLLKEDADKARRFFNNE